MFSSNNFFKRNFYQLSISDSQTLSPALIYGNYLIFKIVSFAHVDRILSFSLPAQNPWQSAIFLFPQHKEEKKSICTCCQLNNWIFHVSIANGKRLSRLNSSLLLEMFRRWRRYLSFNLGHLSFCRQRSPYYGELYTVYVSPFTTSLQLQILPIYFYATFAIHFLFIMANNFFWSVFHSNPSKHKIGLSSMNHLQFLQQL